MSNWYVSKLAAQAEYNSLGNSMNYAVMAGRAWIYRHAYRAVAYDDDTDGDWDRSVEGWHRAWQVDDTTSVDTQVASDFSDDYDISWTSDF